MTYNELLIWAHGKSANVDHINAELDNAMNKAEMQTDHFPNMSDQVPEQIAEMFIKRIWKYEALHYLLRCEKWLNSPYRREQEYANYLKRFFFGDGEITYDGNNETWQNRMKRRELPMPTNVYLYE